MAKRGRPSREPSNDEREKVRELAKKASVAEIAKLVGRSVPNLRKYFSEELFSGKKSGAADALPFKITKKLRDKVAWWIGCNMSPARVALALDCTAEQLEASFQKEIARGHAIARTNVLDRLKSQMNANLVGATNRLEALTAAADPDAKPAQQAAGYVGKKEAARIAADQAVAAGGKFAPRVRPHLAVDNSKP